MQRKKLVIISHTEHHIDNGVVKGWGSTINEINYLSDYWEEVIHVACLHTTVTPPSSLPYANNNITFVPIPPYGGKRLIDKILIFTKIPSIIKQVLKSIDGATEVQLRLPTSMGLFLLPLFSFFVARKFTFWVKYAGNWNEKKPPLSYNLQRFWLKKNWANCKVSINGFWDNQPSHCFSFENPCLTLDAIEEGKKIAILKTIEPPFVFAFVGRLEEPKGVNRIIEALKEIPLEKIGMIHFIGNGDAMAFYKKEAAYFKDKVTFHGFAGSDKVHEIIKKAHFLLLPSTASEGFPKVIAEAACYGVVPIVSNVGSIGHYIDESNGFIWDLNTNQSFTSCLAIAIETKDFLLKEKSKKVQEVAEKFTFVNYRNKLENLIFN